MDKWLLSALLVFLQAIIFNIMNSQNNEDDSMNFSVIDRNQDNNAHLDFSVRSLLENHDSVEKIKHQLNDQPTTIQNVFKKIKQKQGTDNKSINMPLIRINHSSQQNFLKDLSRMEKELSFQTQSYDIYGQNHNNSTELVANNKSKTLSYLKATKEYTNKSISKENYQDFNDYYGQLIIDFHKIDTKSSKIESKNISNNLSSEHSNRSKPKLRKESKSHKQIKTFYRLKQKLSPSNSKMVPSQQKKSKSKSLTHKLRENNSKSHSNLKISTEAETRQNKVFTEYYGTEIHFKQKKTEVKKKKETLQGIKSRQKSSKSKLGILSPRIKQVHKK